MFQFIKDLHAKKELIWQLTKRDINSRYRGSILGLLWSFANPIFMLSVYTFLFSIIFKAKLGTEANTSNFSFAIKIFTGLIPFAFFSECINRAPSLIINNPNYVKKVVFPLDILPLVSTLAAIFHAIISCLVLFCFYIYSYHTLHWTVVFIPMVNLPLIFLILGLSWSLAAIGVFIRDLVHSISMITTALMFFCPIFYSLNQVPEQYQVFINLNPLSEIIEQNRAVIIGGLLPNFLIFIKTLFISVLVCILGYTFFNRTKRYFADVV